MNLVFRKMTERDLEQVMHWRMQPDVTRFMTTDPKLTLEGQRKWFEKQQQNPHVHYWIVVIDDVDAGVVSIVLDSEGKSGETSSYIAEKACKSLPNMTSVIASLLDCFFDDLGAETLYGDVLAANKGVVLINRHLGYTVDSVAKDAIEKNGLLYDQMRVHLTKAQWHERRKAIEYTSAKHLNSCSEEEMPRLIEALTQQAQAIRRDLLRMGKAAGPVGLHFGGSLSIVEIVATLYGYTMHAPLEGAVRDRLILSKGHGVPTLYACLKQLGVLTDEELMTFKSDATRLYGHPSANAALGIDFSTGSLGQGLSLAVGFAMALKRKRNAARLFVLLGDGECNEGAVWEAAASAAHFKLDNLMAIVDRNQLQYDGDTASVMNMDALEAKFESFGWAVHVVDGHDIAACCEAFNQTSDRPVAIVADTVKGKGISFMEGDPKWHHSVLSQELYERALEELSDDRSE